MMNEFDVFIYADKIHNFSNIKFEADKLFYDVPYPTHLQNDDFNRNDDVYNFCDNLSEEKNILKNLSTINKNNLNKLVSSLQGNGYNNYFRYDVLRNGIFYDKEYFYQHNSGNVEDIVFLRNKVFNTLYDEVKPEINYTFDKEVEENNDLHHGTDDDATITISNIKNLTERYIDELIVTTDFVDENGLRGFSLNKEVTPTYPNDENTHKPIKVEYFINNEWKENVSDYAEVSKVKVTYYNITKDETDIPNIIFHGKGRWQDIRLTEEDKEANMMSDLYLSKERVDIKYKYFDDKNNEFNLDTFNTTEKNIMRNKARVLIQTQVFGTQEEADAEYDPQKVQKLGYRPGDTLYSKIYVKNLKAELPEEKDAPLKNPLITIKVPEYTYGLDKRNIVIKRISKDGTITRLEEGNNKDYYISEENLIDKDFGGDQIVRQSFNNTRYRNFGNFSDIEIAKAYDTNYQFVNIHFINDLDVDDSYDITYSYQVKTNGRLPMTYKEKNGKIYNAYFPKFYEYGHDTYSYQYVDHEKGYPYFKPIHGYYEDKEYLKYNGKSTDFEKIYFDNKNAMMDLDNLILDVSITGQLSEEEPWEFLNYSIAYIPGSKNGSWKHQYDVDNPYYDFIEKNGVNRRLNDYDINSGQENAAQKTTYFISTDNRNNKSWDNISYIQNNKFNDPRDYYKYVLKKRYESSKQNDKVENNVLWATTKTRLQKAWILGSSDIQPLDKEKNDTANYKYVYGYGDYQKTILSDHFRDYDRNEASSYRNYLNRDDKAVLLDDRFTALQYNQKAKHSLMAVNYGDWHLNGLTMTYVLPNGFVPDFNKGFTAKILSSEGENTYDGFNEDITNDVTMEVIQRPEDTQVYKALKTSASPQFNENGNPEYYDNEGTYVLKFTVNHKLNKWFNRGNEAGYKILIEFESIVKDSNDNETWNDQLIITPKKDNDSSYYQILDIDQREGTAVTKQNTQPFMNYLLDDNGNSSFEIGTSVNTPYINGINIQNSKFTENNSNGELIKTDEHSLNENSSNYNFSAVTGTVVYMRKPNINTWVTLNNSSDGKFKANDYKTYYINKVGEQTKVNVHIQNKFNLENVLPNYSMTKSASVTDYPTYFKNNVETENIGRGVDDYSKIYKVNNKYRYNSGTIGGNEGDYIFPIINVILPDSLYPIRKDGKAVHEDGENIISWKLYDKDGNLLTNEQNKYETKVTILNVQKENSSETEKKYLIQIYSNRKDLGNPQNEARIKYNDEYIFSIDTVNYDSDQIDNVNGKEFLSPISIFASSYLHNFKFITDDDVISLMDKKKEEMSKQTYLDKEFYEEDANNFYSFIKKELKDMYRIGGTWNNVWTERDNSKKNIEDKEQYSRMNPDDYHETMYKNEYLLGKKYRDYQTGQMLVETEKVKGGNLKKLDEAGNHGNTYKLIEYNHRYNETDKINLENSGNYNLFISNYDFSKNGKNDTEINGINVPDSGVFTQFNPRLKYPLLKLDVFVSDNLNEITNNKDKFEYGNKVYFSSRMKIEQENDDEYGQYGNMFFRKLEETIAIPYSANFNNKKEFYVSYHENVELVTKTEQELKNLGWKIAELRNTIEKDPIDSRKQYNIITYSILIPEKDFDTTSEKTIMDSFVNGHPVGYLKNGDEIYFRIGTRIGNILEEKFVSSKEDNYFEPEKMVGMLTTNLVKEDWMKKSDYNIVYHNRLDEDGTTWFKDRISVPDVNKNGNTNDSFARGESKEIQIKKPNADVRIDTGKPRVRLNNKDAEKALIDDPYMKSIQNMDMFITNAENKTNVNEFIVNVDVPKYATQYRSTRYADKSDYLINSVIHSVRTGKWKFNNDYQNEAENYRVIVKARISNNTENDFRGTITSDSNIDDYVTIGNKDGYALNENAEILIPTEYERKITNIDFVITRKDTAPLTSDSNLRKENPVYSGLTLDVDALDDVTETEYLKIKRKKILSSLKFLKPMQKKHIMENGTPLMTKEEIDNILSGYQANMADHNRTDIITSIFTQEELNDLLDIFDITDVKLNYLAGHINLTEKEKEYVKSTIGIQNINDVDPDKTNLNELSKSIQENAPKINVSEEIINGTNSRKHLNYFATIWAKYDDYKFGSISNTERAGFYVNPQLPYLSANIYGKYFAQVNDENRTFYKWVDDLTINPDFSTDLKYDLVLNNIGNAELKKKFGMDELEDNATNPEISVVLPYFETLNQSDFKEIDYNTEYKNSVMNNTFEKDGNINHEKPIWTWYVVDKTTGQIVDDYKDRFSVKTQFGYKSVDLSTYKRKIINWKFNGVLKPNESIHVEFLLPLNIQDLGLVSSNLMNIKDYIYKKGNFLPFIDSNDLGNTASSLEIDTRDINFDGNKTDMTLTKTGMSVMFLVNTSLQKTKKASTEIENNTKDTKPAGMPENTDVEFNVSVQNPGLNNGKFGKPIVFDILPYKGDKEIITVNASDKSERPRGSKWNPYLDVNSFEVKEYSAENISGITLDKDKYKIYVGPVRESGNKYVIDGIVPKIADRRTNAWYRNMYLNSGRKEDKYFVSLDSILAKKNNFTEDEWNKFIRGIKMFMVDFNVKNVDARHRYEIVYKMHSPVNTPVHYGNFTGTDYEILKKAENYTIWNTHAVSIEESDPTESNKAGAYSYAPEETGYIGSYVWDDFNQDGIENEANYEEREDGRRILKSYNTDTDFDGENNDPGINGVYVELLNENGLNVNQRHEAVKYLESEDKYVLVDNVTGEYLYDEFGEHLYTELKPKTEYTTFDYYGNKGYYLFSNLTPGNYKLRFTLNDKDQYVMTTLRRNDVKFNVVSRKNNKLVVESDTINVKAFGSNNDIYDIKRYNKNTEFNVGVSRPYTYGGYAFLDTNTKTNPADGIMDNERKLQNIKVSARYEENPNVIVNDADGNIAVTKTDENGYFKLRLNPNHKYVLKAENEFNYSASPITIKNDPLEKANDNDLVNTENGSFTRVITVKKPLGNNGKVLFNNDNQGYLTNNNIGLGFVTLENGSIGNLIWNDKNYNGIYDFTEESGIPNVTLKLNGYVFDGTNWTEDSSLSRTIKTNETGSYVFAELPSVETRNGKNNLIGYKISAIYPEINGRKAMVSKYNRGNALNNNDYNPEKDQMDVKDIGEYIVTLRKASASELENGVQTGTNVINKDGKSFLFGYDINSNNSIDSVDGAFTEDEVSNIKGKVFLDKNDNGIYDEGENLKNIDVILEKYVQDGNNWRLDGTSTVKTTENGEYLFNNLPSHTERINGEYKLYSYKVRLNANVLTKYIEARQNIGTNDDVDSDLSIDGNLYLTDDYIVFAKDAEDTDPYYEINFNGKKYDAIKNNPDDTTHFAGLRDLEYSVIKGTTFKDVNYDGIRQNSEERSGRNIHLIPYYYDNGWKELESGIIDNRLLHTTSVYGNTTETVKVKGSETENINLNNGDYIFKDLPTFVRKNNTRYLVGYKIKVDYEELNVPQTSLLRDVTHLITKYHVSGNDTENDSDVSAMTNIVNNEVIISGKETTVEDPVYVNDINNKKYDMTHRTVTEHKDYGSTNVLSNVVVNVFEDANDDGIMNDPVGYPISGQVKISPYYYDEVSNQFRQYDMDIPELLNQRIYINNLPTYFVVNGKRKLAAYKIWLSNFDKNTYTLARKGLSWNPDLSKNTTQYVPDTRTSNGMSSDPYVTGDEYLIPAVEYRRKDENPYRVSVPQMFGVYDIAHSMPLITKYNIGLRKYPKSNIKVNLFEDTNYDGTFNKGTETLMKENLRIIAHTYYLDNNQFVKYGQDFETTMTNGTVNIENLPTFINKYGKKYVTGYKFEVIHTSNNIGYTKHIYDTNLLNNMALLKNGKTAEIVSPQAEFKTENDNGYVIVAKKTDERSPINPDLIDGYDISHINDRIEFNIGMKKFKKTEITGDMFDDDDYNGIKVNDKLLSGKNVVSNEYYFDKNDNTWKEIPSTKVSSTITNGKFSLMADTYYIKDNNKYLKGLKPRLEELPKGYFPTKYQIGLDKTIDSDLIRSNLYITENYIPMAKEVESADNRQYLEIINGKIYDLLDNNNETRDIGVTKYKKGTIKGYIFDDKNYNGLKDEDEEGKVATIEAHSYMVVDGNLVENGVQEITSNETGLYEKQVDTYATDDSGKIRLLVYKLYLKEYPENYTATKYHVVGNGNSSNLLLNKEIIKNNENLYIPTSLDVIGNEDNTSITFNGTRYDIVKGKVIDNVDIGLISYKKGSISGTIFEDDNYNGIHEETEQKEISGNVTLKQYYYNNTEWVETTFTKTINKQEFTFENLPTFVEVDNEKYLAGYKVFVENPNANEYAITKYKTNNGDNDSKLLTSNEITYGNEVDGMIILAGKKTDKSNEVKYNNYDIVDSIDVANYDAGFVKFENNGKISGVIFNDINYNGKNDDNSFYKGITVVLEQYRTDKTFVGDIKETTTDVNGKYTFDKVPGFIIEEGNKIPVVYKVKVKELDPYTTVSKYGIDSELRYDNLSFMKDNEYYIPSKEITESKNPNYEFEFDGKKYDFVKNESTITKNGGLKDYEKASISGMIFDDVNFNGIKDQNEKAISNHTIAVKQFAKIDGNWISTDEVFTGKTNENGIFSIGNLNTFVLKDNNKYLAGYEVYDNSVDENTHAVTIYGTDSFLKTNSHIIQKPNDYEGKIVLAKLVDDLTGLNEVYDNKFDIVESTNQSNYNGGIKDYEKGIIKGTIFEDKNYDGLMNDNTFVKNTKVQLLTYKLPNAIDENSFIGVEKEATTNDNGEFTFDKLDTFKVIDGVRTPVVYQVKVKEIPNDKAVTKYRVNTENIRSNLVKNTLKLNEKNEYFVISDNASNVNKADYNFDFNGKTYNYVKAIEIADVNGGLKTFENNGIISGRIWNDKDYNGVMNNEEKGIENISVSVEQYKLIDGHFELYNENYQNTNTDKNGEYHFSKLETFITENGVRIPVSYKVKVNQIPDNYAITKYNVVSTIYRNSDLRTNLYLNKDDEYIIVADKYNTQSNSDYSFTYEGKTYDIVKSTNASEFDGGLVEFKADGQIRGQIFEDVNYDGIMNDNSYIKGIIVEAEQYKYINNDFVKVGVVSNGTSNDNGDFVINNLPTFIVENGTRIPVAYKIKVKNIPDNFAVTKYQVAIQNNEKHSDLRVSDLYMNKDNEYIFVTDKADAIRNESYEFTYNNTIYDIVKPTYSDNHNAGLKIYEQNGKIEGTVFNDKDYNGLMNEEDRINGQTVILETYKLVNGKFVKTNETQNANTDENGNFKFENLQTFIFENGNRIPVSYKLRLKDMKQGYAVTKYRVPSNEFRNSDLKYDSLYLNEDDEFIIVSGNADEIGNVRYEFEYDGQKYDLTKAITKKDYDAGVVEYSNGETIEGQIFNDKNYDGLMNDDTKEKISNISISLNQYILVNGKWEFNKVVKSVNTDKDGKFKFENVKSYIVNKASSSNITSNSNIYNEKGNEERIPVAYRLHVDKLPENTTVTKYRVNKKVVSNSNLNEVNSDLVFETHDLNETNEFIILSKVEEVVNTPYSFEYENKNYDYIKTEKPRNYNGGIKEYETGSIEGRLWEDENYDGLQNNNEPYIEGKKVTLKQYYLDGSNWIFVKDFETTTDKDGKYQFTKLVSHLNGKLTGYKVFVENFDENQYAITKYFVNNGKDDSSLMKVASASEIKKPNQYKDMIIISKEKTKEEQNTNLFKEIINKLFNIVEATEIENYDGGVSKFENNGSIKGKVWLDGNRDSIKDEDENEGIPEIELQLEQYKLVNGNFEFVKVYDKFITTESGEFEFKNLPLFSINENGKKEMLGYKIKATDTGSYGISEWKDDNKLNDETKYIGDIIIVANDKNINNDLYEFEYDGVKYNFVKGVERDGYYAGLYRNNGERPYVDINKKNNNPKNSTPNNPDNKDKNIMRGRV